MTDYIKKMAHYVRYEGDIYPHVKHVNYSPADEVLPEAIDIAHRLRTYILAQEPVVDDGNIFAGQFRFDGSVPGDIFTRVGHRHFGEVCGKYYCKPQENLATFEWQHSSPDYATIIDGGIEGLRIRIAESKKKFAGDAEKNDFLDALAYTCDAVILWAHKCADAFAAAADKATGARKSELLESADILRRVPEHRAETFREAVQSLYLCFDMLPDSIGTIDRYLRRPYENDIAAGRITEDYAKRCLQELFIRIQSRTPLGDSRHNWGGECHFAIGGYLPDGSDGYCELTKLIVDSIMDLPLNIPEISLRWTPKLPDGVLRYFMDCERKDPQKRIAFVNDVPRIDSFMKNLGLSYEDACSYTMVGCNEPAFPGAIWFGGCTINICRAIVNTLYNCSDEAVGCRTFDEFFDLFNRELTKDIDRVLEYCLMFNAERAKDMSVISSLFLDGCIESGIPANRGGCRIGIGGANIMGLIALADSLSSLKWLVYDEKIATMEELIDALRKDWDGYELLRTRILKNAPYHGNGDMRADEVMMRLTDALAETVKGKTLNFGQKIVFGTLAGYNPHYVWFGKNSPATPDGRHSGDLFLVGSGQSFGRDREGLSALLTSIARMQPSGILAGPFVANVLLDEALIRDDRYFDRTVKLVETYFREGGMHIQLNYVTREELLAARKEPEKHSDFKVRVSGFSAYFTELREETQDEIIERTEIHS